MAPPERRRPLTEAQINMISAQTERAASKALTRYVRRAVVAYLVLFAGLLIVEFDNFQQREDIRRNATNQVKQATAQTTALKASSRDALGRAVRISCVSDHANAVALRKALEGQKAFVIRSKEPPPPTLEQRIAAINEIQRQIIVPDCKKREREAIKAADGE